jgi:hypothetical protein
MVTIDTTTDGNGNVTSASYQLTNIYYQLGQFSKFVPVGATRIDSTVNAHGVFSAAFRNPNGQDVLVATNMTSGTITFEVTWDGQGSFSYTLDAAVDGGAVSAGCVCGRGGGAVRIGIPEGTVKSRPHYALRSLRSLPAVLGGVEW